MSIGGVTSSEVDCGIDNAVTESGGSGPLPDGRYLHCASVDDQDGYCSVGSPNARTSCMLNVTTRLCGLMSNIDTLSHMIVFSSNKTIDLYERWRYQLSSIDYRTDYFSASRWTVDQTIIDCGGRPLFKKESKTTVAFQDIQVIVRRCIFSTSLDGFAGVFLQRAIVRFEACEFYDYKQGSLNIVESYVELYDCEFSRTSLTELGHVINPLQRMGGAVTLGRPDFYLAGNFMAFGKWDFMHAMHGVAHLMRCSFILNEGTSGGALHVASDSVTMWASMFSLNEASIDGGAVFVGGGANMRSSLSLFQQAQL